MVEPRSERWWGFGSLAPLTLFIAGGLVLIAVIAGYTVAARSSPTYVAQAGTMLDQPLTLAQVQDAGVVEKLSRLRLKYAGILRSDKVVEQAAEAVGRSRDDVADTVFARLDGNSLLLYVGATSDDEEEAVALANALASALRDYVTAEQRNALIAASDRISLDVVQPAHDATPVLPTARQKLVAGFSSGLVAFVVLGGVLDVVRRRRRA